MNLILKETRMKNFLSFKDEKFNFNDYSGLSLINGTNKDIPGSKNGCGKSSLFMSVIYALYGRLPYTLKKENVVNRYSDENSMEVALDFSVNENDYTVVSGTRGKTSYCYLFKYENDERIDITKSTMAETREFISDHLIKSDLKSFMHYILLNSDPNYNYFNLDKDGRQKLTDKMFNLGILVTMFDIIHGDKKTAKDALNNKNNEIMSANRQEEEYSGMVSKFDISTQSKLESKQKSMSILKEKLNDLKSKPMESDAERVNKFSVAIKKLGDSVESFNKNLYKIGIETEKCKQLIKGNLSSLKLLNNEREKMGKFMGEACQDCLPKYRKCYSLEDLEKKIEKLTNENELAEKKINELIENKKKYDEAKLKYSTRQKELISTINKESKEYRDYSESVVSIEKELAITEAEILNIRSSSNPYIIVLENVRSKIKTLTDELSVMKKEFARKSLLDTMFQSNGIKTYIAANYVSILNGMIKNYMHMVEAPCELIFDSDMNYTFVSNDGKSNPEYANFSSGEQSRISIAVGFSFRDFLSKVCGITSNVLFIDEFIDKNIDAKGIECIQSILEKFAESGQHVFVVSHRSELDPTKFENVVNITKENNISTIHATKR